MDDRFYIGCGVCKRAPTHFADPDGTVVVCPGCGQRDSAEVAYRIASQHDERRAAGLKHIPTTDEPLRWQVLAG
jgi:hypothetical protein